MGILQAECSISADDVSIELSDHRTLFVGIANSFLDFLLVVIYGPRPDSTDVGLRTVQEGKG